MYFGKEFASFHTSKIELLGQRDAKLLAVKVGALKKKSAALAIPAKVCASAFSQDSSPPGSNHSQSLTARIFAAL